MRFTTTTSSIVVIGWLLVAVAAPILIGEGNNINLEKLFSQPSSAAWFGHDDLGRDIGPRILAGASVSCLVAVLVVSISVVVGTMIGMFLGWRGGFTDLVGVRVIDVFLAFPGILLAIALAAVLGPGIENVMIALSIVGWVGFARLARAQTLSVKHRDHVQVARALGTPVVVICRRHILPLILAPLIVEATFAIAAVIIAEAGLSFLGLGVQPPTASWGAMIREGTRYLLIAPHMAIGPGLALFSMVLAVNTLGDKLRDNLQIKRGAFEN
ncbi:MAG: peptide/nickel transport system permease protein [Gammaproteobacteria bacterium]|jgi:peptide/nickel transport system permease protein